MALFRKTALLLSEEDRQYLQISVNPVQNRCAVWSVQRYFFTMLTPQIAKLMGISVPNTDKCIKKTLQFGVRQALEDFKRTGRPVELTSEARAWISLWLVKNQRNSDTHMNYGR